MAHLFAAAPLPEGSRFTHLWDNRRAAHDGDAGVVSAHFVHLPEDQSADVESDFLSSHLPFCLGGVAGVHPDGSPWLLVLQHSQHSPGREQSASEQVGVLDQSMRRAVGFNPGTRITFRAHWRWEGLARAYGDRGVDVEALLTWSLTDLALGLLAECCGASLVQVVSGRAAGCAFPGRQHACQHDVFDDVFTHWHHRGCF